jgi:hypothetical protein
VASRSPLPLPRRYHAQGRSGKVAATDGADEVGIELRPRLEAVENGGISAAVLEKLAEQFCDRTNPGAVHVLDDSLKADVGTDSVGDLAFQDGREVGAAR